jgi:nitronate monooxygenase
VSKREIRSVLESLKFPIWQAPTSSLAGPELCAAVSKTGGMGSMALTWTPTEIAIDQIAQVRSQTANPFLVNYALALPPTSLEAMLELSVQIITFSWGDPEPYIQKVKNAGAMCGVQVTNVSGAKRAISLGADFLICQGIEAGGHVQSTTPLANLLPDIIGYAVDVPVIAAGGMSNGMDIARILEMGAAGAILGTRFLATLESRAHDEYKQKLVESSGETALTVCFDGDWPYSAHRVLRNSTLDTWEAFGCPSSGMRPGEWETVAITSEGESILRYESAAPKQGYCGNIEAMCLYSGTGVIGVQDILPARELIERLWAECVSARSDFERSDTRASSL